MEKYTPKVGDIVEIKLIAKIRKTSLEIKYFKDNKKTEYIQCDVDVRINETGDTIYVVGVPDMCVEPFNPQRTMEDTRFA